MQRGLLSLYRGRVAGGGLKATFKPQDLRLLGSLTELCISGRTLKIIPFSLFPDGYSRLGKLGRRISDGWVGRGA